LGMILVLPACTTTPTPPLTTVSEVRLSSTPVPAAPTEFTTTPRPDLSTMSVRSLSSVSPDRQWRAEALLASFRGDTPYDYARLTVSRTDYSGSWIPYDVLSEYDGLGTGYISDFYWSADGRYLYFKHTAASEPCGYPFTTKLHQVDLQNGSLSEIPLTGMWFGEITISADARRMAYRVEDGILIYDLADGNSRTLPYLWPEGHGYLVGWNAWSTDGEELAFSITEPLCDSPERPHSSVYVIDLEAGETRRPANEDTWVYLPDHIAADPVPTAALALQEFLNSLYWAARGVQADYSYERAADLYGGSYETLIEMNPDLDPKDHAALLRSACQVNGFQCLRLRDVLTSFPWVEWGGVQVVYFTVNLAHPDEGIFALGSCCGGENGLPQTRFSFSVRQFEDGTYKVLELPPYVP